MNFLSEMQLRVFEKAEIECKDTVRLLGDIVDGDLPECLLTRVKAHIDGCEECQEQERSYREVIMLARQLREVELPNGVQGRLRDALNKRLGINLSGS